MTEVWHALADPWGSSILRHAFAEVALIGVSAGALGCWVVLFGLSYGAESLAHGMLPGLVVAALAGVPLVLGGAGGALLAGIAIALASRVRGSGGDNAVAVVITTLLGAGVLLALSRASPPGLGEILFGDVLGAGDLDLALAGGLAAVVLAGLAALHGRLLAVGFDPAGARALGISSLRTELALLVLLALAVLVAVQGLGNLLVVAVLIAPAATARLLARRMAAMLALAAGLAIACGFGGLYLSYYLDIAAGAAIAGTMVAAYVAVAGAQGIRARSPRRRRSQPAAA